MAVDRPIRTAEVIAVGSELLTPRRLDTNSLFLTAQLDELGIAVRGKVVVGDDRDDLRMRLAHALERADLVVTTGGLGPTDDDLTREAVASALDRRLEEDPALVEGLRARFARRGRAMPEINRRQAQVPERAMVLPNLNGSAPALWIETDDGRLVICLPGPARELQPIVEREVLPRLRPRASGHARQRRVVMVTGRSESEVEELVRPLDAALAAGAVPIARGILASPGLIEIHVSASGADDVAVGAALERAAGEIAARIGAAVVSLTGQSLETVVGEALRARRWRLAAAESCTGGLLMGRLTDVPGSSAWLTGGIVAYADEVKVRELGVPEAWLAAHGAVSEPVAEAMARGVRERLAADVGVAVTGIAGPGGGSDAKPVGTVVIAVSAAGERVRTFVFPGDRSMVRAFSVAAALDMVRREIAATA
jgi:nicotinamide-nucleotide amidase